MRHTGTLFLSRTPPQASTALCGAFQLQLLLLDRLGPHHSFWQENASTLKAGAALVVELERVQIPTLNCHPLRSRDPSSA